MKTIKVGTSTKAIRAQEILSEAGINAGRKKRTGADDGCSYVVTVQDRELELALKVLRDAEIKARVILEG